MYVSFQPPQSYLLQPNFNPEEIIFGFLFFLDFNGFKQFATQCQYVHYWRILKNAASVVKNS